MRPATGVPTVRSSPAPVRVSSAASAACSTMNGLVPVARASRVTASVVAGGSVRSTVPPRPVARAGRGRSAGSGTSSGAPRNCSAQ